MNETANMLENALHGGEHRLGVRIYFEDTDAGGIVYHANYLRYAERARSEALRSLGVPHAEMVAVHDRMFVVRHAEIDYERPARLDDLITVATRVRQVSAATVMLDQTIRRGDETLVRIGLLLACVDRAGGRAVRLPADMRAALMRMHEAGVPGGETGDGQRAVEGD
ncbi:MAG TPA: tol-pal system-associated acyl-CoA thioesterase [Acidiphilium sp.]|jgi:acyl-CoA thioester hydrolase|uniref:tol-pal system-associated acyl-CoA thioesterase n=1 Tax=unclassified Acidiphilium TaxID=2617493 RepID=UPI000BC535CC|nr:MULTISPECIES: tol-pal system-associated acyl-CoA thioesterase [unclassified Acidiphilium]OYV55011.1 MAG: tol-pal system-associated acyl-CoA thioesterase [Acidiphilium sp. 20-67-58]HQT62209.1 tol-pal system-associated acyl-CoA thioesterase [Acidiphilium sp.]HQU10859.1 tol-pal system-associated acyl-CoA thioesterase [Acidiphilium sp.]